MPRVVDVNIRFFEKVNKTESCWVWKASLRNKDGYGSFNVFYDGLRRNWLAHRFSWVLNVGPIANGLHVLHKCDNPLCVNPEHLFLGTHENNMGDMKDKGRHKSNNKIKTHCNSGHEFNYKNTYIMACGGRQCRVCDNIRNAKKRKLSHPTRRITNME